LEEFQCSRLGYMDPREPYGSWYGYVYRKGLGAYYTIVGAASLLSYLALHTLYSVRRPRKLLVADFACGSGILLDGLLNVVNSIGWGGLDNVELYCMDASREALAESCSRIAGRSGIVFHAYYTPIGVTGGGPRIGSLELLFSRVEHLPSFNIIIMNPPFTRSTGGSGLFRFMDDDVRRLLLNRYRRVRLIAYNILYNMARGHAVWDSIRSLSSIPGYRFTGIGPAGESILYLALADMYLEECGVAAFVLPRTLLTGSSWLLARTLLLTGLRAKYIIVTSDPRGYSFSSGSNLSEVLIIASKCSEGPVYLVNLYRRPLNPSEGVSIAKSIVSGGGGISKVRVFTLQDLMMNIDNWFRLISLRDDILHDVIVDKLYQSGVIEVGGVKIKLPLSRLGDIV